MKVGKFLDTVRTTDAHSFIGLGVFVAVLGAHFLRSIRVPFYAFPATFIGPIVTGVDLETVLWTEVVGICVNLHATAHAVVDASVVTKISGSNNTGRRLEAVSRTDSVGFRENVHAGTQDVVCSGNLLAVVVGTVGIARPGIIAGMGHRRRSKGDQQTPNQGVPLRPTHLANMSGRLCNMPMELVSCPVFVGDDMCVSISGTQGGIGDDETSELADVPCRRANFPINREMGNRRLVRLNLTSPPQKDRNRHSHPPSPSGHK